MRGILLALWIPALILVLFVATPNVVRSQTTSTPTDTNEPYPGPDTSTTETSTPEPYPGPETTTPIPSTVTPTSAQRTATPGAVTPTLPQHIFTATPPSDENLTTTIGITTTATATLIPFPELQVIFPTVVVAEVKGQASADLSGRANSMSWFTWDRLLFLAFILLIWLLLGSWFYFSLRRLE